MDVSEVLAGLRRFWWLVVVGLLIAGGVAMAANLLITPRYATHTQFFVSTTGATSTSDVFTGSQFSQQRVASYARLLTGEELAERVIEDLDLSQTPEELIKQIEVSAVPNTVLLDVTVKDPSAEQAQAIAAAVGDEFTRLVRELETPDGEQASPVTVTVTDAPEVPIRPSEPQILRNLALGLLVGALVGVAAALVRARMDRSVRSAEVAAEAAGAPVIGVVLRDEALHRSHVMDRLNSSVIAEDFRQLRTNLQFLSVDRPPKTIMISSAVPSEGKTTLTINLALALADAGQRVVLVEADLRRPRVTRYLGMVGGVGLTSVLAGTADVDEVIQPYGDGSLSVLAAGPTPPNPGELLASSHMATTLAKLRTTFDYVIIDAPPLLPVADASGLAPVADGVVLSVRHGVTHKAQLAQAAATLERVGARTLGIVLNIVPPKAEIAEAYGHGYGYGYETGKHSRS